MIIRAASMEDAIKKYEQALEKMTKEVPDFLKGEIVSRETSEEEKRS